MLNLDVYIPLLVIVGAATAGITGLYLGVVMSAKWDLKGGYMGWTVFGSAAAAAVVFGIISAGIIGNFGLLAGFIANFLALPLIGMVWLFIVGGNKVLERILSTLLKKLSA